MSEEITIYVDVGGAYWHPDDDCEQAMNVEEVTFTRQEMDAGQSAMSFAGDRFRCPECMDPNPRKAPGEPIPVDLPDFDE